MLSPYDRNAQQYPSLYEAQQYGGPGTIRQYGFYGQGQQHVGPGAPFQFGFHNIAQQQSDFLATRQPRYPAQAHEYGGPSTHRGFHQQATVYGPLPGTLQPGSHQQTRAYDDHPAPAPYSYQHRAVPQQGGLHPTAPSETVAPAPQRHQSAWVPSLGDFGWISEKRTLESARDIDVSMMPEQEQETSKAKAKAFIKEVQNSRSRSVRNNPYPSQRYGGLPNFWDGPQGWFTLGSQSGKVYIRPEDRKKGALEEREKAAVTAAAAGKRKKKAVGRRKAPRSVTLGRSPLAVTSGSAAAPGRSPTPEGLHVDEGNSAPRSVTARSATLDRSMLLPLLRSLTPGWDTWYEGTLFGEGDDDSGLSALSLWMDTSREGLPVVDQGNDDPRSPTPDMETTPEYENQVFFCDGD